VSRCPVLLENPAEHPVLFIQYIDKPQTIKILKIPISLDAPFDEQEVRLKAYPDNSERQDRRRKLDG
jgi:hypothetical protein